jgi:hypothetical protein
VLGLGEGAADGELAVGSLGEPLGEALGNGTVTCSPPDKVAPSLGEFEGPADGTITSDGMMLGRSVGEFDGRKVGLDVFADTLGSTNSEGELL